MGINDCMKKTLLTGMIGLSLIVLGCQDTQKNDPGTKTAKMHKNCYGLHLKENPNGAIAEFYKDGYLQSKEPVTTTITIEITPTTISYMHDDRKKTYTLQTNPQGEAK